MYTLQQLIIAIKEVFINTEKYEMYKHITDFHTLEGEYIGDYFNLFIQERIAHEAPKLYHIGGPYDVISHQAPQRATCYQGGTLLINQDITHEVDVRTAAMNFVVLSGLGISSIHDKNILIIGTGKVAKECLKQLKEYDHNILDISYHNHHGAKNDFEVIGSELGIHCNFVELNDLSPYDIIILHTSSTTPIITKELFETTQANVIITSFAGASSEGEIEYGVYNEAIGLIIDREQTKNHAKDLKLAKEKNQVMSENTITIKNLISGDIKSLKGKPIIYRSTGAPMQTLAIVKLLS